MPKLALTLRAAFNPQRSQTPALTNEQEINSGPAPSKESHGRGLKTHILGGTRNQSHWHKRGQQEKLLFSTDAQVKKNKISQECVTGQLLCEFVV